MIGREGEGEGRECPLTAISGSAPDIARIFRCSDALIIVAECSGLGSYSVTVTEALVLRPLLEDVRGRITRVNL